MPPRRADDGRADGSSAGLPALPPHLDPRRGNRHAVSRYGRRQITQISTGVLATVLSASLLLFFGYAWWNFRDLNNNLRRIDIHTGVQGTGSQDIDGKDQNLLIVGNDDRRGMTAAEARALHTGRTAGSLSTDTMMIVHIPADGSKATLISLPRDSYVNVAGHGMQKLNSAYGFGYLGASGSDDAKVATGANLLIQTVTALTGLTIDHFVQVGLLGFYRISNAIGGVNVNLCNAVNDSYSGLHLSAGEHSIKGVTALEFVRQRHGLTNGDIDRTQRQRYFLTAAFRKIASAGTLLNPGRLRALVHAVDKSLYVDQGLNITSLALQMANLSANNIVGKAIPYDGFADTPVGSVVVVNPAKVKAFVSRLIGSSNSALSKAKAVDPSTVSLSVLNAGSTNGAAGVAATTLRQAGFTATAADSGTPFTATTIQYPAGMESQAKTLALYVPGATVREANVSVVTLVLGSDGISVNSQATAAGPSSSSGSPKPKPVDSGCIN